MILLILTWVFEFFVFLCGVVSAFCFACAAIKWVSWRRGMEDRDMAKVLFSIACVLALVLFVASKIPALSSVHFAASFFPGSIFGFGTAGILLFLSGAFSAPRSARPSLVRTPAADAPEIAPPPSMEETYEATGRRVVRA